MSVIKILHSADWHLDAPLQLHDPEQGRLLRKALQGIPAQISRILRDEQCDLMLLSGDLFDGAYAADTLKSLKNALAEAGVPVFISPGNHDYIGGSSPWLQELWPENVHIFTRPEIEAVDVPSLDCCVYGAGYVSMDCPGLLQDFRPTHTSRYAVGVLHGDPTQIGSPYCPVTAQQVAQSGLDYLALGHIHKAGSFRSGATLCAWPGCPMGRGYDEQGEKGLYIVTLEDTATIRFVPLDTPRFYDLDVPATQTLNSVLPPVGNADFYRITFTGPSEPLDLAAVRAQYAHFPNLFLRDQTVPPTDIWASAGEDTFEGMYFKRLQDALENSSAQDARHIRLAAQISRQLLDGQEVELP